MTAIRVRFQGGGILGMVGYSFTGHIIFLILTVFLPRVIPRTPPPPVLLTASIVSSGEAGLAGGAPPAPAPAKAAPTPEERAEAAARHERTPREEPPPAPKEKMKKADPTTPPPPGEKPSKKPAEPAIPAPAPASAPPPASGAVPLTAGVGLGTGGGEAVGGVPSINSASFPYQYYRVVLVNSIRARWNRPLTPGLREALRCAVAFVIARDGRVSDVLVSVPSGFPPLDDSAARAVLDASPLPPLPYQYGSESVRAEMIFELTPD